MGGGKEKKKERKEEKKKRKEKIKWGLLVSKEIFSNGDGVARTPVSFSIVATAVLARSCINALVFKISKWRRGWQV